MENVIYVTVAISLKDGADVDEVVQDMDYSFDHDDIIDAEIRHTDSQFVSGIGFLNRG